MSALSNSPTPKSLRQLVRLYEIRQKKALHDYQDKQSETRIAQQLFTKRTSEHDEVLSRESRLQEFVESGSSEGNILTQSQISVNRSWIKYDAEKTQYFLNAAEVDFKDAKAESEKFRRIWVQIRDKCDNYRDQLKNSLKSEAIRKELDEELELEEERVSRQREES